MWRAVTLIPLALIVTALAAGCTHTQPPAVEEAEQVVTGEPELPGSYEERFDWKFPVPNSIAISPDGRFALYSIEKAEERDGNIYAVYEIRRLDLEIGTDELLNLDLGGRATGLAISPDGRKLAAAWYGHVAIIDLESRTLLHDIDTIHLGGGSSRPLKFVPSGVGAFVWTAGGEQLVGTTSDEILWWDANSGQQMFRVERATGWAGRLSSAPGGRVAAIVKGGLEFFDNGDSIAFCPDEDITTFVLSPDGRKVAIALFEGPVRVWGVPSCEVLAEWSPQTTSVPRDGLAWLSDGQHLMVGSREGTVTLRNANTGEPIVSVQAHDAHGSLLLDSGGSLLVDSDGRRFVTWGDRTEDGLSSIRGWKARQ